ncbi:MAG: RnfABCDGE type electron transport complex subunit C, partial [Candidatus Brocadiales bacterium]|nr:RnfABCDGE type electron transport complex subunit C [Candidatus Brocadiales bacterium]
LSNEPQIKIDLMEVKYPQGAEHQLIKALLNREFKPTQLPLEVGAIVINVGTAFAVYEAVKFKRPLIERLVTVTGNGVENPQNFLVRLGTPIKQLLEEAKVTADTNKIIFGGPMMGIAQGNIDAAVTIKGTGGILVLKDARQWQSHACIRCGRCIDACPYGLNPSELSITCEAKEFNLAIENNVMECKECGCCSYICPAKRPIVHLIKFAKAEIAKQKAKAQP